MKLSYGAGWWTKFYCKCNRVGEYLWHEIDFEMQTFEVYKLAFFHRHAWKVQWKYCTDQGCSLLRRVCNWSIHWAAADGCMSSASNIFIWSDSEELWNSGTSFDILSKCFSLSSLGVPRWRRKCVSVSISPLSHSTQIRSSFGSHVCLCLPFSFARMWSLA